MAVGPDEQVEMPEALESPDYQAFLDDYNSHFQAGHGELLHGHVLSVSDKEVIVDIGRKTEGLVPASQFPVENGLPAVKRGDVIEVMIDRTGVPVEGYILLSYERAHRQHVWEELEAAAASGAPVSGRVTAKVKGGLAVDIGVNAFLPSSQVEIRPIHNLDPYVGQTLEVRILKLNRRRANAVVSRRVLLENDRQARKAQALAAIFEGAEVQGVVKNLTDYGAFVDLGGIDGLLHVSDLSYGNVSHPAAVVSVGQELTVKVLKFDPQHERISLGLKQLRPDPWVDVDARYPPASRVIGRVVSVTDYGAFVELEPGVEGLIHISEMTWSRRMKHPSKIVTVGDQVEAVVLEVKPRDRRISLGIKQLEADPWTTIADRYSVGSVVEGRVRKLADFGAFVEIEDGIDGLVHVSDMSWTAHVKHPSELIKKGQLVQAVVLQIDPVNRRLSLGIKQLQPDSWEVFFRSHQLGDVVRGKVCRAAPFGVFVELLPGVEGLCHRSEIASGAGRHSEAQRGGEELLPVGTELDFKVIKLNEAQRRIGLSLREVHEDAERSRIDDYRRQAAIATSTVGDAMKQNSPKNYRNRNYDEG
ncbi:MAG TPA: 30S ribosomal protein S1 [Bryobacteraceae bacterium]|jgi:small subunit ribosomal protein S1|nr:30S ribosomal protein S1 [Bryobacteraceae bacterium]